MSRYDGLIIPRSYSEYINKTDAATLQQALQLSGVLSGAVAAGDNKAVKSSAVNNALANYTNDKYLKNISPTQYIGEGETIYIREISFPLKETEWFCGEVLGNLHNYGNICFYLSVTSTVISSTPITKTDIIGDSSLINITIDDTNNLLKMSCDKNYAFNSITFIHS